MRGFRIALILMILAFGSLKANCAVLGSEEIKAAIVKQVIKNSKKYTNANIEAKVVTLPFQDVTVPNGTVTIEVQPSEDKFMPRDLEKVGIFVNGKLVKKFNAPVVVKAYKDVLVAAGFVNRGTQINQSTVRVETREVSNKIEYALDTRALSREILAKKAFRDGELIDKRFIKQRPDVLRNAMVTTLFKTNNLTIIIDTKALSDGVVGDTICIINKDYNRVYKGKIIGENKVLVRI